MNPETITTHLIEMLTRGAILLALGFAAFFLLRRSPAMLLRQGWRATFVALLALSALALLPPLFKISLPATTQSLEATPPPAAPNDSPIPQTGSLFFLDDSPLPAVSATNAQSPIQNTPTSKPAFALLAIVWLSGAVFLLGRMLLGHLRVRRLIASAKPLNSPAWQDSLEESKDIQLLTHWAVRSPLVAGLRRPVILLPENSAGYTPQQRRAVLIHELEHIRHRDGFFQALAGIVRALHWPNPLAWVAHRHLRLADERACDDATLQDGVEAPDYAEILTTFARGGTPLVSGAGTLDTAMAKPATVITRIERILDGKQRRSAPGRAARWATAIAAPLAAIAIGGAAFAQEDSNKDQGNADTTSNPKPASNTSAKSKLDTLVLPSIDFTEATLDEALYFFVSKSKEMDPTKTGLNIVNQLPNNSPLRHHLITMELAHVPFREALRQVCANLDLHFRETPHAVLIYESSNNGTLMLRTWKIPHKIFGPELENSSKGPPTAKNWAAQVGVRFPEGASAFYAKRAGALTVQNTGANLDKLDAIINALLAKPGDRTNEQPADAEARANAIRKKLDTLVIPSIDFTQATLHEAIGFLRVKSQDLDTSGGKHSGIQFVVRGSTPGHQAPVANDDPFGGGSVEPPADTTITLRLENVPFSVAIRYIAEATGVVPLIGPYAVELVDVRSDVLVTRTYDVKANAMFDLSGQDPDQHSAVEINGQNTLSEAGITFHQGASAYWSHRSERLVFHNTIANHRLLEAILESLKP